MTTDQDKAAMNAAWEKRLGGTGWPAAIEFANGFAAALEYARQTAEPVAWVWNPVKESWEKVHVFGNWQQGAIYAFGENQPQPEPLVRLTDDDVREIANREFVQTNHSWESKVFKFANAIMDAMQAKAQPEPDVRELVEVLQLDESMICNFQAALTKVELISEKKCFTRNADLDDMPYQGATIKEAAIYCKSAADKLRPIFQKLLEAYLSKAES